MEEKVGRQQGEMERQTHWGVSFPVCKPGSLQEQRAARSQEVLGGGSPVGGSLAALGVGGRGV